MVTSIASDGVVQMTDTAVRIMLPIDGRILTVDLDDAMTGKEIIDELLAGGQIQPNPHGYQIGRKGGDLLNRDTKSRDLALTDQDVLRVIPATDAGL
jgi:hypothetical protein